MLRGQRRQFHAPNHRPGAIRGVVNGQIDPAIADLRPADSISKRVPRRPVAGEIVQTKLLCARQADPNDRSRRAAKIGVRFDRQINVAGQRRKASLHGNRKRDRRDVLLGRSAQFSGQNKPASIHFGNQRRGGGEIASDGSRIDGPALAREVGEIGAGQRPLRVEGGAAQPAGFDRRHQIDPAVLRPLLFRGTQQKVQLRFGSVVVQLRFGYQPLGVRRQSEGAGARSGFHDAAEHRGGRQVLAFGRPAGAVRM
ncbi:MAG: hypothetical protein BWZ10_02367 [candidate division BRC1 bacterium ADurb.BinA364]|nr:MAG: hypothetical protein BWZ10_02367 [candidate division BRC1 bacterium ADurb.BinA364]